MLTVTTLDKLPTPKRNRKRSLEFTSEWIEAKQKMQEGLAPNEAIVISLNEQRKKELGVKTIGRTLSVMIKIFIRNNKLPYDTWRFHNEGQEMVVIAARPAEGTKVRELPPQLPPPIAATHKKKGKKK